MKSTMYPYRFSLEGEVHSILAYLPLEEGDIFNYPPGRTCPFKVVSKAPEEGGGEFLAVVPFPVKAVVERKVHRYEVRYTTASGRIIEGKGPSRLESYFLMEDGDIFSTEDGSFWRVVCTVGDDVLCITEFKPKSGRMF